MQRVISINSPFGFVGFVVTVVMAFFSR